MPELGRLKRRPEFLKVAGKGRKWATPGLVLQVYERTCEGGGTVDFAGRTGDEGNAPRVGFTASRRVGSAVERNRAKRRLRAVATEVLGEEARPDTDYVLIARAGTLRRPYGDLVGDLRAALRRLTEEGGRRRRRHAREAGDGAGREGEGT